MAKNKKQRPTKKEFQKRRQFLNKELRNAIIGGNLKHGELLPSEIELMKHSGLSRGSVRKILKELENSDLIQRRRGYGTTVIGNIKSKKIDVDEILVLPSPVPQPSFYGDISNFNSYRTMVLFEAINNRLRKYHIKCRRINSSDFLGTEIISYLNKYKPQGVLALAQFYPNIDEFNSLIAREGIPVVTLASNCPIMPNIMKLTFDNCHMAQVAAEYLVKIGHENIIEMTCRNTLRWADARVEAFQQYCRPEPGTHVQILQISGDIEGHVEPIVWQNMGRDLVRKVLSYHPETTAIFCINDLVAYGAILEARKHNIKIPQDLSIMGCGDDSIIFGFNITTVSLEAYKIGTVAVDSLVKMIKDDSRDIASANINVNPCIINHDATVSPRRSKCILDSLNIKR